jgi:hypothetical protein
LAKINAFDELKEKFIFNCSGLGAVELAKDTAPRSCSRAFDYAEKSNPRKYELYDPSFILVKVKQKLIKK